MNEMPSDRSALGTIRATEDLGIYLLTGRVKPEPLPGYTHVGQILDDASEAERLGFRRVWLAERLDLKEAAVCLSAVAARTTRLEFGTAALAVSSRHPLVTAALGATMQALHGPRFVLGLGRGIATETASDYDLQSFLNYAREVSRVWRGSEMSYRSDDPEAPSDLTSADVLGAVPPPPIWFCTYGGPRAAAVAADPVFDGVMLCPFLTPAASAAAVSRIRQACARAGRSPSAIRICQPVVVAADLDDATTRSYAHARAVTYFGWPGFGEKLVEANGWDPAILSTVRSYPKFQDLLRTIDLSFHRAELLEAASLIPDELMAEACAIGTASECANRLRAYRDVGVDELAIYGSTPAENAHVVAEWTRRTSESQH